MQNHAHLLLDLRRDTGKFLHGKRHLPVERCSVFRAVFWIQYLRGHLGTKVLVILCTFAVRAQIVEMALERRIPVHFLLKYLPADVAELRADIRILDDLLVGVFHPEPYAVQIIEDIFEIIAGMPSSFEENTDNE